MPGGSDIRDVNELLLPERIGPYRVDRVIGRGGMGVVYLGYDANLKREVSIKALPRFWADDPERQRRLRKEAQVLAGFNHPNIALIYGLEVEESGAAYLIMEYVPGRTLREAIREEALPLARALEVGAIIARTMEQVHNRGVIHRDLKPANVRITPDGQVKVLDFGLAVATGAHSDADATTTTHHPSTESRDVQGGTPGYMSPEQVRGLPVDHRADIFSFGCVLFECLAGRRAFRGSTRSELENAVLEDDPEWDVLPRRTPAGVFAAIQKCLERDLARRALKMTDVRAALEDGIAALRAGPAVEPATHPTNLPPLLGSFVGREDDIAAVRALALESRLTTLTGSGGCGKTTLALRVGESLLPEFTGGVWLVELAGLIDPGAISVSLASVVGVAPGQGAGESTTGVIARLASARSLILFDNCEHLITGCRGVIERLLRGCPKVHVLVTSQAPIDVRGESVFIVPSLDVPGLDEPPDAREVIQYESVQLFVQRARAANPRFQLTNANAQGVARICRRLDGIPLAIELAAARAKLLSPAQIEEHLGDMFRLLTGGRDAVLERHRTLGTAVEWSFQLLAEDEREMMRALGVFAGGWTLEAAVAVCDEKGDEYRTIDLLERLVSKSLLVREEPREGEVRFRLLETLRQYVRRRGVALGAADRHCSYYLSLAERIEKVAKAPASSSADDVARIDLLRALALERDNLLEAQRWAFQSGKQEASLRLTRVLRQLWSLIVPGWRSASRSHSAGAGDTEGDFRAALAMAERLWPGGSVVRARLLARWAELLREKGRLEEAGAASDEAIRMHAHLERHDADLAELKPGGWLSEPAPGAGREDANWLNQAAWGAVRNAPVGEQRASRAIVIALRALELLPEDPDITNTLGVAFYRAALFDKALDALLKAHRQYSHRGACSPEAVSCNLAFTAMTYWRLANHDGARAALAAGRRLIEGVFTDDQTMAVLREASELIEPENAAPVL